MSLISRWYKEEFTEERGGAAAQWREGQQGSQGRDGYVQKEDQEDVIVYLQGDSDSWVVGKVRTYFSVFFNAKMRPDFPNDPKYCKSSLHRC